MSNGVPGLDSVVELAEVVRSGFVESRHFGLAVALSPDGSRVFAAGDVDAVVLPRSTAKPLQAVGSIVAGAVLEDEEAAIAAGSHTGSDAHVALVDRMLAAAGLGRDALGCPPDRPEDEPTRFRLIAEGIGPEKVRMNCSGKHAAMLMATVAGGNDPLSYLDADSPVQRTIAAEIERLTGAATGSSPSTAAALPCSACRWTVWPALSAGWPQHQPVRRTAGWPPRCATIPELVGGHGHLNTEVMRLLPGVIAKGGAEGVIGMAAPDGHAVAVKVIDGNPRATTALGLALLEKCGVDVSAADELRTVPILGGGQPVGEIVVKI